MSSVLWQSPAHSWCRPLFSPGSRWSASCSHTFTEVPYIWGTAHRIVNKNYYKYLKTANLRKHRTASSNRPERLEVLPTNLCYLQSCIRVSTFVTVMCVIASHWLLAISYFLHMYKYNFVFIWSWHWPHYHRPTLNSLQRYCYTRVSHYLFERFDGQDKIIKAMAYVSLEIL